MGSAEEKDVFFTQERDGENYFKMADFSLKTTQENLTGD